MTSTCANEIWLCLPPYLYGYNINTPTGIDAGRDVKFGPHGEGPVIEWDSNRGPDNFYWNKIENWEFTESEFESQFLSSCYNYRTDSDSTVPQSQRHKFLGQRCQMPLARYQTLHGGHPDENPIGNEKPNQFKENSPGDPRPIQPFWLSTVSHVEGLSYHPDRFNLPWIIPSKTAPGESPLLRWWTIPDEDHDYWKWSSGCPKPLFDPSLSETSTTTRAPITTTKTQRYPPIGEEVPRPRSQDKNWYKNYFIPTSTSGIENAKCTLEISGMMVAEPEFGLPVEAIVLNSTWNRVAGGYTAGYQRPCTYEISKKDQLIAVQNRLEPSKGPVKRYIFGAGLEGSRVSTNLKASQDYKALLLIRGGRDFIERQCKKIDVGLTASHDYLFHDLDHFVHQTAWAGGGMEKRSRLRDLDPGMVDGYPEFSEDELMRNPDWELLKSNSPLRPVNNAAMLGDMLDFEAFPPLNGSIYRNGGPWENYLGDDLTAKNGHWALKEDFQYHKGSANWVGFEGDPKWARAGLRLSTSSDIDVDQFTGLTVGSIVDIIPQPYHYKERYYRLAGQPVEAAWRKDLSGDLRGVVSSPEAMRVLYVKNRLLDSHNLKSEIDGQGRCLFYGCDFHDQFRTCDSPGHLKHAGNLNRAVNCLNQPPFTNPKMLPGYQTTDYQNLRSSKEWWTKWYVEQTLFNDPDGTVQNYPPVDIKWDRMNAFNVMDLPLYWPTGKEFYSGAGGTDPAAFEQMWLTYSFFKNSAEWYVFPQDSQGNSLDMTWLYPEGHDPYPNCANTAFWKINPRDNINPDNYVDPADYFHLGEERKYNKSGLHDSAAFSFPERGDEVWIDESVGYNAWDILQQDPEVSGCSFHEVYGSVKPPLKFTTTWTTTLFHLRDSGRQVLGQRDQYGVRMTKDFRALEELVQRALMIKIGSQRGDGDWRPDYKEVFSSYGDGSAPSVHTLCSWSPDVLNGSKPKYGGTEKDDGGFCEQLTEDECGSVEDLGTSRATSSLSDLMTALGEPDDKKDPTHEYWAVIENNRRSWARHYCVKDNVGGCVSFASICEQSNQPNLPGGVNDPTYSNTPSFNYCKGPQIIEETYSSVYWRDDERGAFGKNSCGVFSKDGSMHGTLQCVPGIDLGCEPKYLTERWQLTKLNSNQSVLELSHNYPLDHKYWMLGCAWDVDNPNWCTGPRMPPYWEGYTITTSSTTTLSTSTSELIPTTTTQHTINPAWTRED